MKNQSSVLSNTFYTLKHATIDEVKESEDVIYHHVSRETPIDFYNFKIVTIHKEVALKHLDYKTRIPIKYREKRKLHDVIDDKEQTVANAIKIYVRSLFTSLKENDLEYIKMYKYEL